MKLAVEGVDEALQKKPKLARPLLLGVTVLTGDNELGANRSLEVRELAHKAVDAGFKGLVCSPIDAEMIRNDRFTKKMIVVTPGIRPAYAIRPDEQRANAATPRQAIEAGAHLIVVGRPIIEAQEYGLTELQAFNIISEEVTETLAA